MVQRLSVPLVAVEFSRGRGREPSEMVATIGQPAGTEMGQAHLLHGLSTYRSLFIKMPKRPVVQRRQHDSDRASGASVMIRRKGRRSLSAALVPMASVRCLPTRCTIP